MVGWTEDSLVWMVVAVVAAVGVGCGGGGKDETEPIILAEDTGSEDTGTMDADAAVCDAADEELCNGEDDDCDGVTDESCACEFDGTSVGVCKAGLIDEEGNCKAPPGYSENEETCDGQDNDCDGVTDEKCECTFKHRAKGVCANALIGPDNGACSEPQVYENDESTCDGKDNDCDGIADEECNCVHGETRPCYTGPDGTNGFGQCAPGREACKTGAWTGSCRNQVTPSASLCDGKDNDCDGDADEMEIDEGFENQPSGWSAFSDGRLTPSVTVPASDASHSGASSGRTEDREGICGQAGGLAKEFDVGPNVDEISMYLKARTYEGAVIGVALKDSEGIHQLWRKRASGNYVWRMNWRKKTFDISEYDDKFTLIIGNVDDTRDCESYYHRWRVWVDDIRAGVDCR
ncbi:MAG: MopE-related protein [Bradymonadaceae bacterium]